MVNTIERDRDRGDMRASGYRCRCSCGQSVYEVCNFHVLGSHTPPVPLAPLLSASLTSRRPPPLPQPRRLRNTTGRTLGRMLCLQRETSRPGRDPGRGHRGNHPSGAPGPQVSEGGQAHLPRTGLIPCFCNRAVASWWDVLFLTYPSKSGSAVVLQCCTRQRGRGQCMKR